MRFENLAAPKSWRTFVAFLFALSAGLGINQVLFGIAAKYQAQVTEVMLEDMLNQDELLSDPHLLAQTVSNLQSLGLIRCTSMSSQKRPELADFVNLAQGEACSQQSSSWTMPVYPVQSIIHASNGEEIETNYQVILGKGFAIGLWGSRLLWIILVSVFTYAISARFRHQKKILELEAARSRIVSDIAQQVSHDLVSPLATLDELLLEAQQIQIPEGLRFKLRNGIGKIRDIINELKSRPSKQSNELGAQEELTKRTPELLSAVIDSLVSEKCIEFRSRSKVQILFHQNSEDLGLFASVNALKLQRVLSNLINNAVQALKDETGQVDVLFSRRGEGGVQIEIKDNGVGIPPEIRSKLGQRGQTFGRATGSGLGLFDAKTTIENWAGELVIGSLPGEGTSVKLMLPKVPSPRWFLDSVLLRAGQRVVTVDDDSGIHGIFKRRIRELPHGETIEVLHFHSAASFKAWYATVKGDSKLTSFFFDYELLGESENGLDLIESLSLQERSALVTSRYDAPLIRERSNRLGLRMLPKTMALHVPMTSAIPQAERPDAILVEDDLSFSLKWSKSAKKHGKVLKIYSTARSFLDSEWIYDRTTPTFVDVDLGEESGEELTRKLSRLGFQELHLATGYDAKSFDLGSTPWVKSVRDKTPPWES